jgi:hypothetical protein
MGYLEFSDNDPRKSELDQGEPVSKEEIEDIQSRGGEFEYQRLVLYTLWTWRGWVRKELVKRPGYYVVRENGKIEKITIKIRRDGWSQQCSPIRRSYSRRLLVEQGELIWDPDTGDLLNFKLYHERIPRHMDEIKPGIVSWIRFVGEDGNVRLEEFNSE